MAENGLIYIATSRASGKSYIGQTVMSFKGRIRAHVLQVKRGSKNSFLFGRAIAKHGIDDFVFTTIDGVPRGLLNEWEAFFIRELGTFAPAGYNLTTGGGQQSTVSEETRRKISSHRGRVPWNKGLPPEKQPMYGRSGPLAPHFGVPASKATIEACRETGKKNKGSFNGRGPWNKGKKGLQVAWNKGKPMSEQARRKLSETRKGRFSGENHPMFGKHHSEETRRKIAEAHKGVGLWHGRVHPMLGQHHSEESKRKIADSLAKRRGLSPSKT